VSILVTSSDRESAAQFLFAARKRGTPGPRIPVEFRPADIDDALAIQARVTALVGQPVGGYKCSVPSGPRPVSVAPIFAPTIAPSPYVVLGIDPIARIEPEIAFVMGRDLPTRATPYSEREIRDAIKDVRLVLEILGPRYSEPASVTYPELLADGLANQGLLLGPVLLDPWNSNIETFPIGIRTAAGVVTTYEGQHADKHPLRPLYWLANYLASGDTPLRTGMIVTTGSYCGAVDVPLDIPLTFAFGDLGTLSATLKHA
jgi:2-keto-4-pentenoate hydratase